jgi:Outer membrane protein beta-barrel domain
LKRHTLIGGFACACILGMATMLQGQALPTASRVGAVQVGAGWWLGNPDFAQSHIQGMVFYSDFDFTGHLGVEGEIHYSVVTPTNVSENLYLIGPRYVVRHRAIAGYAKALFGPGYFELQIDNKTAPQTGAYFAYAVGGGVEVHVTNHINIRAFDFEFQKWPTFPTNGLSPYSGSVGAAYVFK